MVNEYTIPHYHCGECHKEHEHEWQAKICCTDKAGICPTCDGELCSTCNDCHSCYDITHN